MTHPDTTYDLIFSGGTIVDGTNSQPYIGDVAIQDDRIVAIGDLSRANTQRRIDITGLALAPGFIDSHTHDDNALLRNGDMTPKVSQGVTTVVTGNCGISLAPLRHLDPPPPLDLLGKGESYVFDTFSMYLDALRNQAPTLNAACLIGHSTLRAATMPELGRAALPKEIDAMQRVVADALDAGAIGVSTGTFYRTAEAAPTEELIEVCRPLTPVQGIYATHMRDEGDEVIASLNETFHIGRELRVPVVVSHHKLIGEQNFGRSVETLALIREFMHKQEISLDVYPYVAGSTILKKEQVIAASRTLVTWCTPFPEYTGRDLDDIARERGKTPVDVIEELQPAGAIYFMMDETDVQRIMAFSETMICSDGLPHDTHPHPRLWGTFPRVLGHYSRDLELFPLQTAIWKMTGLTASRFGLKDRGTIRTGSFADLVVFDPTTIADTATFEKPINPSKGVHAVFVNGTQVWDMQGNHTGARPGRVLERTPVAANI